MTTIAILCCGGTIDKIYFDANSSYQVGAPAVNDILTRARTNAPSITSVCKKDSLDMSADDRAAVVAAIQQSAATRLMICHGTDTMTQTARHIEAANIDKTVVLVGAFLPAVFRDSDADFNIGFALAAVQTLSPGVYVAMNGKILSATTAQKDVDAGCFV